MSSKQIKLSWMQYNYPFRHHVFDIIIEASKFEDMSVAVNGLRAKHDKKVLGRGFVRLQVGEVVWYETIPSLEHITMGLMRHLMGGMFVDTGGNKQYEPTSITVTACVERLIKVEKRRKRKGEVEFVPPVDGGAVTSTIDIGDIVRA